VKTPGTSSGNRTLPIEAVDRETARQYLHKPVAMHGNVDEPNRGRLVFRYQAVCAHGGIA
jgi:hypothetical protein